MITKDEIEQIDEVHFYDPCDGEGGSGVTVDEQGDPEWIADLKRLALVGLALAEIEIPPGDLEADKRIPIEAKRKLAAAIKMLEGR